MTAELRDDSCLCAMESEPCEAPILNRFDDMADMLALDVPLPQLPAVPPQKG